MIGQDHPRLRGEKNIFDEKALPEAGSPPLTRGKGLGVALTATPRGITPAYAGKRFYTASFSSTPKDHPRLRGEKERTDRLNSILRGSPPLTRGKAGYVPENTYSIRITPAYAGKRT